LEYRNYGIVAKQEEGILECWNSGIVGKESRNNGIVAKTRKKFM
jgi:hypothetical protein